VRSTEIARTAQDPRDTGTFPRILVTKLSDRRAWKRSRPWLPVGLAVLAVAMLPLAAAHTDLAALTGLGLGAVLPVWAWLAVLLAVSACALEIGRPRPRMRVLTGLTGVLVLCTTGIPSMVEPAARIPTAWVHLGMVNEIATTGAIPSGVDSRFSWAGFFAQWAWIQDAAGGQQLDTVLRWAPPVIVAIWATGVYAIARPVLGGTRGPWVATWLFCGFNWIEQDYFSPQATAFVLMLATLACVLGPLATRRGEPAGQDGWPLPSSGSGPLPQLRRATVAVLTPPLRPAWPPRQMLILLGLCSLFMLAVVPLHQLTPFALGAQLFVLAVAGRFWGRRMLVLLVLAELTWFVVGAREFWTSQLSLATGDVGDVGGSLTSALVARLTGDAGQLIVKAFRVALALGVWILALVGARARWRRQRDLILPLLAFAPVTLVALQSYGGEILLRVLLYGLPLLAVLCVEALRAWPPRRDSAASRRVLAAGMATLFASLVLIRGGNDAYLLVRPAEVALARQVVAAMPEGKVLGLTEQGPLRVSRLGEITQAISTPGCDTLATDLDRCVAAEAPEIILVFPTMAAEGVVLDGKPPGWAARDVARLVADGGYEVSHQQGASLVLRKVGG
jgi:hypothetical protein